MTEPETGMADEPTRGSENQLPLCSDLTPEQRKFMPCRDGIQTGDEFAFDRLAATPAQPAPDADVVEAAKKRVDQQIKANGRWVMLSPEHAAALAALSQPEQPADDVREALEPVLHWYQSDEEHERPVADIVRDVVADLQADRATLTKHEGTEP